ncbi:MAG: Gfo/Idh/MocA family oxidoreductase [Planctomycetes bacterium]|nr:Gfo/Idh/MocA family oxidoreductase [Planctomycetota bacterium]
MERMGLALIGCGGMGHRHLNGLIELERSGFNPFELIGAVDMKRENAESLAQEAEKQLGRRPGLFRSLDELQAGAGSLAAVDICTEPRSHHTLAVEALRRGWHVFTEKPMGLTVRAANRMVRASKEAGKQGKFLVLSVAENYRRDPINRLAKALLDRGIIGPPRLLLHQCVGGGDRILITPWRHLKNVSGILLDVGVHFTDMVEYLWGEVESVTARIRLHERVRYSGQAKKAAPLSPNPIYAKLHQMPEEFRPTAEDACYGLLEFKNGLVGHYTLDHAGHGQGLWQRMVFGSRGSLSLPGDRSGQPLQLSLDGEEAVSDARILDRVPDFQLDEVTAALFGGRRLWRYDFEFTQTDRKLIACEYWEFGDCILKKRRPEVDAAVGARAVALCYAMLESAAAGRTLMVQEVENEKVDAYQREIDLDLGLI